GRAARRGLGPARLGAADPVAVLPPAGGGALPRPVRGRLRRADANDLRVRGGADGAGAAAGDGRAALGTRQSHGGRAAPGRGGDRRGRLPPRRGRVAQAQGEGGGVKVQSARREASHTAGRATRKGEEMSTTVPAPRPLSETAMALVMAVTGTLCLVLV